MARWMGIVSMAVAMAVALLVAPGPVVAATDWVEIAVPNGPRIKALLGTPEGPGPFPAVIYSHGTRVRKSGYQGARDAGYDVAAFVDALAKANFVSLAPIRDHDADARYQQAVDGGMAITRAAVAYLKSRPEVRTDRLGLVGFSEGGLVTLWTAMGRDDLAAVVLMSPATMRDAGPMQLREAAKRDRLASLAAPVMVTLGRDDNASIKKLLKRRLLPNLEAAGRLEESRTDYPGNHQWFWKPRDAYFPDIVAFLERTLDAR